MYKKLVIFFLFSSLTAQTRLSDYHLKGKVQTLESTTYSMTGNSQTTVSGFLDSEFYDAVKLKFDTNGNLVLRENYMDYRGRLGLFDTTIFQYNGLNRIEKQQITLVQNGEEPTKISQLKKYYYLDEKLVRMDEFNFGRTTNQAWVVNYKYAHQNLVEKEFWMEDEIFSREIHTYDLTNKLDFVQTLHNDGKSGQKILYQYDEKRNLRNKITETGNERESESFEYENGFLKSRAMKDRRGEVQLRETFFSSGLPAVIEKINYTKNEFSKYEFKYEFDAQNNWINCLILEDGIPKFRIVRTIIYY